MLLRIFTALVLIPIVVALVWWGPAWVLAAVAALIAILALLEFFDLGERIAMRPFRKWTIVCTAGLFYAQYPLGSPRSASGNRHQFGGSLVCRSSVQLSGPNQRNQSGRPEAGAVYTLPHLGGRHSRVFCRQGTRPRPHGASPEPQENLGRRTGQLARIAPRGRIFCEVAADRSDANARDCRPRKHRRTNG